MSDFDHFPDRRGSRNPYVEVSENEGECDRCGQWSRALRDALCFGCHAHENRVQPPRVAADDARTPGLRAADSPDSCVRAMMFRQRKRIAEQEAGWKPPVDPDIASADQCDCAECITRRKAAKRRRR